VAQVGSQLVFADPTNQDARALTADAYEQLGYQMESATERNAFLQGAWELRNGVPKLPPRAPGSPDVIRSMTLDTYFDALGVRLNGDRAAGKRIVELDVQRYQPALRDESGEHFDLNQAPRTPLRMQRR
jgi:alkyl sulfatase BDS1-like metallo-beta-lactamase superfamily hydrolase